MGLMRSFAAGFFAVILFWAPAQAQSLIRDAEIEAMIREFTDPILVAAELDPEAVNTYIVNDNTMNAFVTGGQNIFLHTGIIITAETPNELKAVIAHEAGHIASGHLIRTMDGMRSAMGPAVLTMAAGLLAALAGEGGAAAGLIASSQQFALLSFFQHTQAQESAADISAVQFLEATGQSSRGLIAFFDRFRYQEVLSERRDPYFRTHPLSSDRIEALRVRVEAQEHADALDPPEHVEMLARAQAKIIGFTEPLRVTLVRYPLEDESSPAHYARAIANFRAGAIRDALREIDVLIGREPDNPYFHELRGQIFYENGRAAEGIPDYRRAVELAPDVGLLHLGLAQSLIRADDDALLEEAQTHLSFAMRTERLSGWAWALQAELHERQGNTALAQLATAERFYFIEPGRARAFAAAARDELERGTPDWHRANDIVATLNAALAEQGARNRRGG